MISTSTGSWIRSCQRRQLPVDVEIISNLFVTNVTTVLMNGFKYENKRTARIYLYMRKLFSMVKRRCIWRPKVTTRTW